MPRVCLCLTFVLIFASGCGKKEPTAPEEIPDGPDWSNQEMLDHFKSRGLPLRMAPCRGGQLFIITTEGDETTAPVAATRHDSGAKQPTVVVCSKTSSGRQAKDMASQAGGGAYAWGRYYFTGSAEALSLVREALTSPQVVADPDAGLDYDDLLAKLRAKGIPAKLRTVNGTRLIVVAESVPEIDAIAREFDNDRVLKDRRFPPDELAKIKPATVAAYNSAVIVMKFRFHVQAIESAGEAPVSFVWKRFSFIAIPTSEPANPNGNDALNKIKSALQ